MRSGKEQRGTLVLFTSVCSVLDLLRKGGRAVKWSRVTVEALMEGSGVVVMSSSSGCRGVTLSNVTLSHHSLVLGRPRF